MIRKPTLKAAIVFSMIVAAFLRLDDEAPASAPLPADEVAAAGTERPEDAPYIELLTVPEGDAERWREDLQAYVRKRYPDGPVPTIVAVAPRDGEEAYRPVPFLGDRAIRYVAAEAGHNIVPYDPVCRCDPTGASTAAIEALPAQEKRELSLLLLRSALYRYAEDHEFALPQTLDDLARPFPNNYVSRVPDFGDGALVYRLSRSASMRCGTA